MRVRDGILGGTPAAGEPLPSERALAEELGCNRHAVREAVKRLLTLWSRGYSAFVLAVLCWHRA
ncbi:hypothetical protein BH20ACT16_BH20ACT16_06120 [soil metagenome]